MLPQISLLGEAERKNNIKKWITFFRRNLHRFITDYLGIKLYPYQQLLAYCVGKYVKSAAILSRASAKSWMAGVIACALAILYPNSEICIVSSTKEQAGIIIDSKIKPLVDRYDNLGKEIKRLISSSQNYQIDFKNGSSVFVVPLKESARGHRATFIILEEFRLLDKDKLESIVYPFKVTRSAPFLQKPEYRGLVEEAKELYITSSGYSSESWYRTIEVLLKQEYIGRNALVLFGDYAIPVRHRIKTPMQIRDERDKMGEESFAIEYENKLIRENVDGFFTNAMLDPCRKLRVAYYPKPAGYYKPGKNELCPPLLENEKLIMIVDVAFKGGKGNDNTIITIDKLVPTQLGFQHNYVYQEVMHGRNALLQALRIKQVWFDMNINYVVMDCRGAGAPLYDCLTDKTIDEDRGLEYPAWTTMWHETIKNYEDYKQRTKILDALPILYPMDANESINSEMSFLARDLIRSEMIRFVCKPQEGEDFLISSAKYFDAKKDMSRLSWFMQPYYQMNETQGEMVALRAVYSGNNVKLIEPTRSARKDRWTTIGYSCWFTRKVLDPTIVKEVRKTSYRDRVIMANGQNERNRTWTERRFLNSTRRFFGR